MLVTMDRLNSSQLAYMRDECDYSLKMYTGAENNKETQHITPHIAAHKSSLTPTSSASSLSSVALSGFGSPQDLAHPHLSSHKIGLSGHIPTYRAGIHVPHQSVVKGVDHDGPLLLPRYAHTNLSTHFSKSAPQDLSAHSTAGANKAVPLELTPHTSHHKPLSHIQPAVSQGMSSNPAGTLMPAHQADRGSAYYRVPDSVINVQGPSAVLVSSVGGDGGVSGTHPNAQTSTLVHSQSNLQAQSSATNLTTMPGVSLSATVSLPGGLNPTIVTSVSQSSMQPVECLMTPIVSSACGMPQADVKKEKNERYEEMKMSAGQGGDGSQHTVGPQRDLVRQALQAVVTHPQHKTELLMMNIQVNASLQAMNKNTVPPDTDPGQVVVLQPAAVDETNSLQSEPETPKRRRPRLSDEAQVERRIRIALRMREKRAGESDEQKRLRRIREAERMRRKRSSEDDSQKLRRRQEAAIRARNRRASMSPEERLVDRQKAADRMRLRRATESDEQKAVRRMKAAERMRKRRASETAEQRAVRRQNIALRMKARRRRKDEEGVNGEESEIVTRNLRTRLVKTEIIGNNAVHEGSSEPIANTNTDQATHISPSQLVTPTSHILVPSSIGVGGSIALLHVDPTCSMSLGHGTPGLSNVDMTQLTQPLPLHKSVTTSQNQEMPEPLSLQKQVVSQQSSPTATPTPVSTTHTNMTTSLHSSHEPLPLHKGTNYHHHLPHLLHYHQHHTSSLQQQQNSHQHLQQRHHQ
nr:uncharacterized protein LOC123756092 isoform X3 [Procambarus clarkii]